MTFEMSPDGWIEIQKAYRGRAFTHKRYSVSISRDCAFSYMQYVCTLMKRHKADNWNLVVESLEYSLSLGQIQ